MHIIGGFFLFYAVGGYLQQSAEQTDEKKTKRATKFRVSKTLDGSRLEREPMFTTKPIGILSLANFGTVQNVLTEQSCTHVSPAGRVNTQVHVAPSGRVDLDPSHFRPAGRPDAENPTMHAVL